MYLWNCTAMLRSPVVVHQFVRYRVRKPWWMGRAKTKMFNVPPRPKLPKEEKEEILHLYSVYRTYMKSIRKFLEEDFQRTSDTGTVALQKQKEDAEEFERLLIENEMENKRVALYREARMKAEVQERELRLLKTASMMQKIKEKERAEAEEEIVELKDISKTFISEEELDEAIEYAMANPVDYNFALDTEGTIHKAEALAEQK